MKTVSYTYTVLQYRHDVWTGEALNVGVLMHCPKHFYLKLLWHPASRRIAKAYPDIDHSALREALREIELFLSRELKREGMFQSERSASYFANAALPDDDSSLRWTDIGSGLTKDPEDTHMALFSRLVARYEHHKGRESRGDEDVFSTVKEKLIRAELYHRLEVHRVTTDFGDVTFEHCFRNGIWHCIRPLSFDLTDEERMQEKAARWVGYMQSISSAPAIQPYFVTGKPRDQKLLRKYHKIKEFLESAALDPKVIEEEDANEVADALIDADRGTDAHPN